MRGERAQFPLITAINHGGADHLVRAAAFSPFQSSRAGIEGDSAVGSSRYHPEDDP